jgi:hypothetical protein
MTQNTTPDSITKWTSADPTSIVGASQAMGDSVQLALDKRQRYEYEWSSSTQRNAQTGMVAGSLGYQSNDGTEWIYENSAWRRTFLYMEATATSIAIATANNTASIGGGVALTEGGGTTDSDFFTLSTSFITINRSGLYSISWLARESADAVINGGFIVISSSGTYGSEIAWLAQSPFANSPVAFAAIPVQKVSGSTTFHFHFRNESGSTRTILSTIKFTRISP